MTWKNLLFLLLATTLFSCKKNKDAQVVIQGTVSDKNTGNPSSGVTVKIYYQEISNSSFSTSYKLLTSTTTDASGNYTFSFSRPSATSYKFELSSDMHYGFTETKNADAISSTDPNTVNFLIESRSWFSVRIRNTSPVGALDQIIYQNTTANDCSSCCSHAAFIYTGMTLDTTFVCSKIGGTNNDFTWSVTKAGSTNSFNQSVYCAPFDTTFYDLNY